jgi:hypothetical protein
MSIRETLEKIKPAYPVLLIVVLASIFFALGRISAFKGQNEPIGITEETIEKKSLEANVVISAAVSTGTTSTSTIKQSNSGEVIGSKSGKKYYFPWCGTVKRILPQNQIHFASIDEAKKAGFTAGGNCKGLN